MTAVTNGAEDKLLPLLRRLRNGIPGICDECFQEQKPSERYSCEHNNRLAVFQDGYWETFRDVEAEKADENV